MPEPSAPIACSLSSEQIVARVAEWSTLVRDAVAVDPVEAGARASFISDPELAARIAGLATREQQCCPFFRFTVEIAAGRLVLEVTAPVEAGSLAQALLGIG